MLTTITIRDETTVDRASGHEFTLNLELEQLTVRELIRSRVYQEVSEYNARRTQQFRGLIQPTDAEATLNGYALNKPRHLDWERQFEIALDAFRHYGFLLLVDEQQVTELDEVIVLRPETKVTFLKLIPLVGG